MLSLTKVEIELISDSDIYLILEKCMRGGFLCIFKRYILPTNKFLKSYKPKQELKHMIYLDSNNLYGYVIPKFCPKCLEVFSSKKFDSNKYCSNNSKDCNLDVSVECPKELHELNNDYPFKKQNIF